MLSSCRVHATLPTSDVDRLRTWYEGVLGLTPLAVRPGAVLYETTPGSVFAISRGSVPSSGTHTQMAFTVADVEAEVAELEARGVVFECVRISADGRRHRDDRTWARRLVQAIPTGICWRCLAVRSIRSETEASRAAGQSAMSAAIALRCSGVLPQQPPTIDAPASRIRNPAAAIVAGSAR